MKFEILQENLAQALSQALKFVSPKVQLPILSNFLIVAKDGVVKIFATDMENSISVSLGAKIEEEGEVAVSAKILSDFVFAVSPGKIVAETEEETLIVSSLKNKAKISTMPAGEFPKTDEVFSGKGLFSLSPEVLKKISEKMTFAVSNDVATRPAMTGVYFDNKKKKLKIVATDGFRLSHLEEKGEEEGFEINVSSKIIEELGKMSQKEEKEIEVFLDKNKTQIVFKLSDVAVSSRLIEGKYPPYEKIIPTDFTIRAVLNRLDFLRAVKTAAIFSKEAANIVRLKFEDKTLKIKSETPSLGENESEIECEKKGEDIEINFNFRYLLDILSRLSGEDVFFETQGEGKPCVFREKDSPNFLHLIMPVKKS